MNLTLAITKGNKILIACCIISLLGSLYLMYVGEGLFIQWFMMIICSVGQIVIATKTIKDAKTGMFNNTN